MNIYSDRLLNRLLRLYVSVHRLGWELAWVQGTNEYSAPLYALAKRALDCVECQFARPPSHDDASTHAQVVELENEFDVIWTAVSGTYGVCLSSGDTGHKALSHKAITWIGRRHDCILDLERIGIEMDWLSSRLIRSNADSDEFETLLSEYLPLLDELAAVYDRSLREDIGLDASESITKARGSSAAFGTD